MATNALGDQSEPIISFPLGNAASAQGDPVLSFPNNSVVGAAAEGTPVDFPRTNSTGVTFEVSLDFPRSGTPGSASDFIVVIGKFVRGENVVGQIVNGVKDLGVVNSGRDVTGEF